MGRLYRTKRGPSWSEGCRLAWLALVERGWSQAELARHTGFAPSMLLQYLYGDKRPGLGAAMALERELGIAPESWLQPATADCVLPAEVVANG